MKLVIVSLTFLPKTGGLENIMAGLADQWHQQGHQVTVFTNVMEGPSDYGYQVIRGFSLGKLVNAVAEADVFFEANISLKTCLAGLIYRKKWFVTHQVPYQHAKGIRAGIKNFLTKYSHNISPSKYVAGCLTGKSEIIPNFYNTFFTRLPHIQRTRDVVFVGRLVSDKGVNDLISSIELLQQSGISFTCSIVGEGPEKAALEQQVADAGLQSWIFFSGILKGNALVEEINKHKTMVIPSRWKEPFGIVALEGLACGCRIVCSSGGGLPEAAGPFGLLYSNGNIEELAESIKNAINNNGFNDDEYQKLTKYLQSYTASAIAAVYLQHFEKIINETYS
jgi:glycosyltransferase involved in cell wall biosynthesis